MKLIKWYKSRIRKKIGNVGLQFSGREGNTKKSRRNHSVFFLGREGEHHRRTKVAIANPPNEEAGERDEKMRSITHINQIRHQNPRNQKVQRNPDKKNPKPKIQMPTQQIPKIPTKQLLTLKDSEGEHPTTRVLIHPKDSTYDRDGHMNIIRCTDRIISELEK